MPSPTDRGPAARRYRCARGHFLPANFQPPATDPDDWDDECRCKPQTISIKEPTVTGRQIALDTQPRRIQRRRTEGWTLAGAAHPLRGGMIVDRSSRYGNPCKVSLMQEMGYDDPHAAAAANYRTWLAGNRSDAPTDEGDQQRERILAGLERLRGKDLACPCPLDRACHADYLLRLANMPAADLAAWVNQVRARVDRQRVRDGEEPMYGAAA